MFQTYIHIAAYTLTILWAIARPALIFKYSPRLRKALGPWSTHTKYEDLEVRKTKKESQPNYEDTNPYLKGRLFLKIDH